MSAEHLREAWAACVARHANDPALRFGERTFTYAELDGDVERAARVLRDLGVRAGHHVGLMLPNHPRFVHYWLALAQLDACLVPLHVRLKGEILAYQVRHADVALVVADRRLAPALAEAVPEVPVLAADVERGAWSVERAPTLHAPRSTLHAPLALIIFTSGTTGRPKGVAIGRQAQLRHGLNYRELLRLDQGETAYVYLPLFHVTAMGSTLGTFLSSGTVALEQGFNPFGFWERTRRYDAKVFTFVGSVVAMLHSRPPRPDDAANPVRRAVGAATPARLWRDFERRFDLEIVETYGQTEMASLWLMPPPEGARVGTVGKPPAGRFEARVVDERQRPLPDGARGELAIRPADPADMMLGYYRDPAATRAALSGDGWYYTGDLATRDEDRYFHYVGRLRDCIRRRGENISAFEVEQVVNAHPAVLESAAVGVPSPFGEEEVKLCVVPRPEARLEPAELARFCRERLPDFMAPRYVELRASLPKTATERVRKADLAAEGTAGCWEA